MEALQDQIAQLCADDCPVAINFGWLCAYVCDKYLKLTEGEREAQAKATAEAEARYEAYMKENPFDDLP